ncbi:dTDP-glucose 4,6-dehydratase [Bacillus daqingensis]|uniref:dTDP-glucose 4,6-dehydratase n=1 Tax=Bacillus daqingensis TaxID=872396 RepID=A0ABV9NSK7_9BACI
MNILVTGGAGFIGRHLVKRLERNHTVVNLDKLTYAGDIQAFAYQQHPVKADICDAKSVRFILHQYQIEAVVHAAAESHVDRSIAGPLAFTETNVTGTHILLEEARKAGITRFVQVSTDEVYGSLGPSGTFNEQSPVQPSSPYSASKAASDMLALAYENTYGMNVMVTRCSNNYGPYQFPEKLIPRMISCALYNQSLPVYGDGLNIRDWLHVNDHCRAIELVLINGISGNVYNIGGSSEMTNLEIVSAILRELDKPESLISFVPDRLGHDRRYAVDASKIKRELGWQPSHTISSGLKETITWYKNNRSWWEPKRQDRLRKVGTA